MNCARAAASTQKKIERSWVNQRASNRKAMDVKKRSLGEICIFRVLKRSTSWSPVAFFTTNISHVWVDAVRKNNVVFGMLVFRLRNHQFECVLGNCTVLWVPPPSPIFFLFVHGFLASHPASSRTQRDFHRRRRRRRWLSNCTLWHRLRRGPWRSARPTKNSMAGATCENNEDGSGWNSKKIVTHTHIQDDDIYICAFNRFPARDWYQSWLAPYSHLFRTILCKSSLKTKNKWK